MVVGPNLMPLLGALTCLGALASGFVEAQPVQPIMTSTTNKSEEGNIQPERQLTDNELRELLSNVTMNTGSTAEHYFYKDGRYFIDSETISWSRFYIKNNMLCFGVNDSINCLILYKNRENGYFAKWARSGATSSFAVRFCPMSK